jgi:hypothetical protein
MEQLNTNNAIAFVNNYPITIETVINNINLLYNDIELFYNVISETFNYKFIDNLIYDKVYPSQRYATNIPNVKITRPTFVLPANMPNMIQIVDLPFGMLPNFPQPQVMNAVNVVNNVNGVNVVNTVNMGNTRDVLYYLYKNTKPLRTNRFDNAYIIRATNARVRDLPQYEAFGRVIDSIDTNSFDKLIDELDLSNNLVINLHYMYPQVYLLNMYYIKNIKISIAYGPNTFNNDNEWKRFVNQIAFYNDKEIIYKELLFGLVDYTLLKLLIKRNTFHHFIDAINCVQNEDLKKTLIGIVKYGLKQDILLRNILNKYIYSYQASDKRTYYDDNLVYVKFSDDNNYYLIDIMVILKYLTPN